MMQVLIAEPVSAAWKRMERVCFRPFDMGKWFTLGFCAFLAMLLSGSTPSCRSNINLPGGWWQSPGQPGPHMQPGMPSWRGPPPAPPGYRGPPGTMPPPPVPPGSTPWMPGVPAQSAPPSSGPMQVIMGNLLLIVGITVAGIALLVVLTWLQSRGKFMFMDGIVKNRGAVVEPWGEFRELGNSYFMGQMLLWLLWLVGVAAVGGAFFLIFEPFSASPMPMRQPGAGSVIGSVALFALITVPVFILLVGLSMAVNLLIAPMMYARRCRFFDAWAMLRHEVMPGNFWILVGYLILHLLLQIAGAIVTTIAGCVTCCIGFLPYLGTVITLPVHVLLQAYPLYFVEQFGPEWRIFELDPQCPRCGYDLRGNPAARSCPECGQPLKPADDPPLPLSQDETDPY